MKNNSKNRQEGFSLIEMVVYIAILVFMLAIILEVVLSVSRSEQAIESARNVENSAALALERISREIRLAESVNTASSTLGVHPGRLILSGVDNEGDPRTVEFYFSQGKVMMRENGVSLGALTESKATATSLIFYRFASSTTEGIRTRITLESGTSTNFKVETFYSSTLIRQ